MELGITGNSAIVAALSSGLGKASAKALAGEGVNVVISGRESEKLESARKEINAVSDARPLAKQADLTSKIGGAAIPIEGGWLQSSL